MSFGLKACSTRRLVKKKLGHYLTNLASASHKQRATSSKHQQPTNNADKQKQTNKQTNTQACQQNQTSKDTHTHRQTHQQTGRQTNKQTINQSNKQTEHTHTQTNKQTSCLVLSWVPLEFVRQTRAGASHNRSCAYILWWHVRLLPEEAGSKAPCPHLASPALNPKPSTLNPKR